MGDSPDGYVVETSPIVRANKRQRRCAKACDRCKSRKQKCDGQEPCSNCVHYRANCVFEEIVTKKTDSTALSYISALEERCAQLESAIIQIDPLHEAVQDHLGHGRNSERSEAATSPEAGIIQTQLPSGGPRTTTTTYTQRLKRPETLGTAQNEEELEGTIRNYLQDLSAKAFAETPYVGELSGLTFAKLAKASVRHGMHISPAPFRHCAGRRTNSDRVDLPPMPCLPDAVQGEVLFHAAFMHVQARYPFMQATLLKQWHDERQVLCTTGRGTVTSDDTSDGKTGAFFIYMTYAVGATYANHRSASENVRVSAKGYFTAAMTHLDDVLSRHDLLTVQALALTAMYSFRAEDGPSVWHLIGVAMRICVEKGFHRKTPDAVRQAYPVAAEVNSRIFWSIYTLDRLVSITLGRPMAIGDEDIDAEEPLDIDCCEIDPDILRLAHEQRDQPKDEVTSMTSACHWIRLFRIRSRIVRRLKRSSPINDDEILGIVAALNQWKEGLPRHGGGSGQDIPMLTPDRLLKGYYMALTLVLRPRTSRQLPRDDVFLRQLAEASAHSCELESNIIASDTPAHSMAALYSTFISGLTLLQALAIQRDIVPHRRSARGIRACTSVLVTYATLFPEAQSFRIAFDNLIDSMEDEAADQRGEHKTANGLARPPHETHQAVAGPSLQQTAESAQTLMPPGPGILHSGASSAWQQKVLDVEAKLQSDLQQDLASLASVFGFGTTVDSGPSNRPDVPAPAPQYNLCDDDFFDFAAYTGLTGG